MTNTIKSVFWLFTVAALSITGHAAEPEAESWQFTITPYLWVATIKGGTGTAGGDSGVDIDYNFLALDNLAGAFFIAASASKGQWTFQTDVVYLNFADNITLGPLETEIDLKGGILELSAGYRPQSFEHTELLFGVRRVSVDLAVSLTPGPSGSGGPIVVDPIIGLRHTRPLGERWQAVVRADIGGFGVSSDLTFNALAGAGFQMTRHSSLFLGYRYLKLDFSEDGFLADLTADGFALGVEFSF